MAASAEGLSDELLPGTRRALLLRLARAQAEGRAPSLVGAVVRDGRIVWTGARGTVRGVVPTAATQYRIGSITKSLVAVLVLRLRDEGLLDLSDPVGRHLPGTPADPLTVAQLLAHTSGLAAEAPGEWWERTPGSLRPELADVFREGPAPHPAGRVHHYSNPGYAVLGALVERLRGRTWTDVLRREVLDPLGMERTTPRPHAPYADGWAVHPWADALLPEPAHDMGRMAPAGQLWSTAEDLARFAAFLTTDREDVLSARAAAEMPVPAAPPAPGDGEQGYGLGLQILRSGGRSLAGHTGSVPGFLAALWADRDAGLGAVALANTTSGPLIGALAADLLGIVADHEPPVPPVWEPLPETDPALLALTGPWYWGPGALALRLGQDRSLELKPLGGPGRAARFRPGPGGTWTGTDGYYHGETLRVVHRPDGSVSHLDIGSFVLTREPYDAASPVPGGVDPGGWRGGGPRRPFVPDGFPVPGGLTAAEFRLEPLGPRHNTADHAAWTSSIEHIRATPGFAGRSWPPATGMTPDENLADLKRHEDDFLRRSGFTYSVVGASDGDVVGCVYIYPPGAGDRGRDAVVRSWVRADRAELDVPLYEAVRDWLAGAWPFEDVEYAGR